MMPRKRKTCRRYNEPGHAHELTFSCYHGLKLLAAERTCQWLAEAIEEARTKCRFDLWAYVFMPEHAHLLIWPRELEYSISSIIWRIKRPVGVKAMEFLEENEPHWLDKLTVPHEDGRTERRFWQAGGGYDRNVVQPETAHAMVEYIHLNPVRRGLVRKAEEWKWSSARWYGGDRSGPLAVDMMPSIRTPR
jgi:putative transposase